MYYLAKENHWGADSPLTLWFEKEEDRDDYVAMHEYCNEWGETDDEYCGYGFLVARKKDGTFYDPYTMCEL